MSDKIDSEPVEKDKEKSEVVSSSDSSETAVSNGLENEKPEVSSSSRTEESSTPEEISSTDKSESSNKNKSEPEEDNPAPRTKSRKNSSVKDPESPVEKMTNKNVPLKPSQRNRMRSRSKSGNSEDLKTTEPSNKEPENIVKASPRARVRSRSKSTTSEDSKVDKSEKPQNVAESSSKCQDNVVDSQNSPAVITPEEEDKSSLDEAMEVDKPDSQSPEKKLDSDPSVAAPEPMDDDENSSDFLGFSAPQDKYSSFAVVLRPFEEVSKKSSQNGPLSMVSKFPHRLSQIRSSPSSRIDIHNPEFKKPFEFGWRRELVFRSTNENSMKRNADVYYYTPLNKKVRSLREVMEHVIPGEGLSAENFTFCKESLGINDPEKEIIREANWKPKASDQDGFYITPVKKSLPKQPKSAPKRKEKKDPPSEASIEISPPSSPGTSSSSPLTPRIVMKTKSSTFKANSKKVNVKGEKRRKAAGPDDSSSLDAMDEWCPEPKAQVREVCSIDCRLAMGLIPTLQCSKCLCLYHPECVNLLVAKERQIHSYVCKYCQLEAKQTAAKLPPPPPLTPIVIPQLPKKDKEIKVVSTSPGVTTTTVSRTQAIVGAVTTWLPPASSIVGSKGPPPIAPRPELESTPQSLISVQGKKFVVIPKMNRVKLDGRGEGGGAEEVITSLGNNTVPTPNPASVYLVPCHHPTAPNSFIVQTPNSNTPTYIVTSTTSPGSLTNGLKRSGSDTGSDGSPPPKISVVSPRASTGKTVPTPKAILKPDSTLKPNESKPVITPIAPHPLAIPSTDFMNLFNAGYIGLLHAFQYLKVHELLRAACVCKMWRHMASHRSLWETVKMKNSRVRNWKGFAQSLKTNGTKCLDLKKMLVPENAEAVAEMWKNIVAALTDIPTLIKVDLGRCTPEHLEMVVKACPQLESIAALSIRGSSLDLSIFKSDRLVELKLKSVGGIDLTNFSALKKLTNLKHLSLTSIKMLDGLENALPLSLESLELGECCQLKESFATETLSKMTCLKRLRLEKGQGTLCPTIQLINVISNLQKLTQLELINFDIKPGFDKALAKCAYVKTLLIIPTYVTQSATTNHVVMGGVTKLSATLDYFIWGLTLELLRVTDLFIDQVEGQKQKAQAKKGAGDSIPILKPLNDESAEPSREGQTTSQVDILALPKLQKVLSTLLPTTRIKILKVPFSATWRQIID